MMEQDRRDAVFGGLPFGVCLVSMEEERILYGNRTFLDMAGASSLESLLESSGGVFRRLVENERYVPLPDWYEEKGNQSFVFRLLDMRGEVNPLEGSLGVYEDEGAGKVWCLCCTGFMMQETDLLMRGFVSSTGLLLCFRCPHCGGGSEKRVLRRPGAGVLQSYEFQGV